MTDLLGGRAIAVRPEHQQHRQIRRRDQDYAVFADQRGNLPEFDRKAGGLEASLAYGRALCAARNDGAIVAKLSRR